MDINWHPGHMTKAKRMLEDNIKLVDAIVEICDARIPEAGRNNLRIFSQRPRLLLLNKSDMADAETTRQWLAYYKSINQPALAINAQNSKEVNRACDTVVSLVSDKVLAKKEKGVNMTVRAMIVGIPNSGKSTFSNTAAGISRAKTGDKPGVTRGKQWIKAGKYLELLDTPGILPPKIENEQDGLLLAYTGAIRDDILDTDTLLVRFLNDLPSIEPDAFLRRYGIEPSVDSEETLALICRKRGWLMQGGVIDRERAARVIFDEFRGGKMGRISLQKPWAAVGKND